MDRFLSASGGGRKANSSRAEPCSPDAATKRRTGKGKGPTVVQDSSDNDGDDASDLEPLSVLMSQTQASPSKRRQKGAGQEKDGERACGSPKKKKLMVPRVSAAGFFDELEVEAEQREARLALESERLERRGVRGGAARWSDVSIIDLTTED
ncbi:hypothetical protein CDD83_5117 [Cordyceps sp. RAO-2017]|nr:hypothetical protein CDD83_5117 [Cordyceps sp. RAO-2017]